MIVKKISSRRNAVPKSGCLAMSSAGRLTMATGMTRCRQVRPSSAGESLRYLPERDDGQELHQLGGLDVEGAEVEPAAAAAHDLAEREHADEQRDPHPVQRRSRSG